MTDASSRRVGPIHRAHTNSSFGFRHLIHPCYPRNPLSFAPTKFRIPKNSVHSVENPCNPWLKIFCRGSRAGFEILGSAPVSLARLTLSTRRSPAIAERRLVGEGGGCWRRCSAIRELPTKKSVVSRRNDPHAGRVCSPIPSSVLSLTVVATHSVAGGRVTCRAVGLAKADPWLSALSQLVLIRESS